MYYLVGAVILMLLADALMSIVACTDQLKAGVVNCCCFFLKHRSVFIMVDSLGGSELVAKSTRPQVSLLELIRVTVSVMARRKG